MDRIYISAATNNTNASISIVLYAIFGFGHGLIIAMIISYFENLKKLESTEQLKVLETKQLKLNNIRKRKILRYLVPIFILLTLVYSMASLYNKTASVVLIYEFEQNLAILRPYIGEEMTIKLSSEWGLMSSENDYEIISNKLNEYSEQNKISLPN